MEVQTWAHEQGLTLVTDYVQVHRSDSETSDQLSLLSPHFNTTYRIDPDFDVSAQQVQIEAAVGEGISQVTIWVDGYPFMTPSFPPYRAWWSLSIGEHRFWAQGVNATGEMIKSEVVTITVVAE